MNEYVSKGAVIKLIHETMLNFFAIDEGTPINDEDRLLLKVNKAICNAIKDMPVEGEEKDADKTESTT